MFKLALFIYEEYVCGSACFVCEGIYAGNKKSARENESLALCALPFPLRQLPAVSARECRHHAHVYMAVGLGLSLDESQRGLGETLP